MTFLVKGMRRRHRPVVLFERRAMVAASKPTFNPISKSKSDPDPDPDLYPHPHLHPYLPSEPLSASESSDPLLSRSHPQPSFIIEAQQPRERYEAEVERSSSRSTMMSAATVARATLVPDLFTTLPPLRDFLSTESSHIQEETIRECLPFLSGLQPEVSYNNHGVPHLDRKRHIQFLHKSLRRLPAPYVAADASRPWMFYWALAGLSTMGEDISSYRESILSTVRPIQNISGGYGGGHGQMSHLAPTYAIILSLAMVGGKEAFDIIDRKAMWNWLGALKQPDGGFQMSVGGEEDVRGAYCAAVIITLLDLPLELSKESPAWSRDCTTLIAGLPEWVARCQTFEGGISGRPDAEAHGAYAFCALACLCILGEPHIIIPEYLDLPRLISWLSARQYAPEGGFSGRTNKLVDGCYSHWVGGCWPLVEVCIDGPSSPGVESKLQLAATNSFRGVYSREGLIRYILCCCQDHGKRGGLRDKPSHSSDSYHTCYVLAGFSSAQHKWYFSSSSTRTETLGSLTSPYQWTSKNMVNDNEEQIYDEDDRVRTLHPVFVIPEGAAEEMRAYFAAKAGF